MFYTFYTCIKMILEFYVCILSLANWKDFFFVRSKAYTVQVNVDNSKSAKSGFVKSRT